jgi:hypothetical protein
MSGADLDDRADELTERYRAASAADPDRPGDALRQSIAAQAHKVAAARFARSPGNDSRWRMRTAASVLIAGFAAVLAWHLQPPKAPAPSGQTPKPASSTLAAKNLTTTAEREAAAVASSRPQAPAYAAAGAEHPAAGGSANELKGGLANSIASAQLAPPPAAPSSADARSSSARRAAASDRAIKATSSPLVTAAESGSLERIDQLLRSGVNPEQTDTHGRTALLVATLHGDVPMVRRLLAAGARADAMDDNGDTPLAVARRRGPPQVTVLLERAREP